MEIKMRVGRWYKLSDGRVVGPCEAWTPRGSLPHYLRLPVKSGTGAAHTIFCEDGTTDYAPFRVVEEVSPPSFAEAGGFYRTKSGVVVGPMVLAQGYDDVFKSERDELLSINGGGFCTARGQQWNHDGSVHFATKYEDGHKLVARVSESEAISEGWYTASAPESNAPQTTAVSEKVLRVDLSASDFGEAFKVVADEFENRINEAVKASEAREAEIERLTGELETMKERRDYWLNAWKKSEYRKQRGDARLRAARQRLKLQKDVNARMAKDFNDAVGRLKVAESEERSKKFKAVVDALGGLFLLASVAFVTWAIVS